MKRVFVGLSGGVDSAVSAYLLKRQGYEVVGAFIKSWEPPFLPCTGARDRLEAMRVAAHLEIPFVTYDLSEEYKRTVVDTFIDEYRAGRTPNPDVLCNREIKFGSFWERASADGADRIATGHYAKISQRGDSFSLERASDPAKDQSYFLWTLQQADLEHAAFPVGGLVKGEVRRIAHEAGLPNADRKDSQGLCFLGHVDMKDFLLRYVPRDRGPVLMENGSIIGEHDGVSFYTIGERYPHEGNEKLYVVGKNVPEKKLIVSSTPREKLLGSRTLILSNVNWVREVPAPDEQYRAQIRYHGEDHSVTLNFEKEQVAVEFKKPVLAAEGQSLVIYREGGECMGGGIISLCR